MYIYIYIYIHFTWGFDFHFTNYKLISEKQQQRSCLIRVRVKEDVKRRGCFFLVRRIFVYLYYLCWSLLTRTWQSTYTAVLYMIISLSFQFTAFSTVRCKLLGLRCKCVDFKVDFRLRGQPYGAPAPSAAALAPGTSLEPLFFWYDSAHICETGHNILKAYYDVL